MPDDERDPPVAEIIVMERVASEAVADYEALRTAVVGCVVSTGDAFAGYAIIEIVPPDEPALVVEATTIEIV